MSDGSIGVALVKPPKRRVALRRPASPLALLQRARVIITQGWCQGAYARDDQHRSIEISTRDAAMHCAGGALIRAGLDLRTATLSAEYTVAADELATALALLHGPGKPPTVVYYNDQKGRTQADILLLFDLAIWRCL
jgi:hypothetical protein